MIEIKRKGKNLFPLVTRDAFEYFRYDYGIRFYNNGFEGAWESGGIIIYIVGSKPIKVVPGKTYTFSFDAIKLPSLYGYGSTARYAAYEVAVYDVPGPFFSTANRNTRVPSINSNVDYWVPARTSLTFTAKDNYVCFRWDFWNSHGWIGNIQLEEGDTATDYEPPADEVLNFETELFSFNKVADSLENGILKKWWKKEIKTTDSSGNFTLSGYMPSTTVIVINNSTGEVKILDVGSTISTGWASTEVTVIYVSSSAVQEPDYDGELTFNAGINNIILPDCACAKITGTRKYLEG